MVGWWFRLVARYSLKRAAPDPTAGRFERPTDVIPFRQPPG
jgi:hypothetical protein